MFDSLFSFAQKKEIEKTSFPLWLANFAIATFRKEETISFENFLEQIYQQINISPSEEKKKKDPQEIIDEISVIANLNREEMVNNG